MNTSRQTKLRVIKDAQDEHKALIETLAQKKAEYDKAKAVIKLYDAAVKDLVATYAGEDPVIETQVEGIDNLLEIGAAGNSRQIKNLPLLVKKLGPATFLELAKVNITDIVKYIPAHEIDDVLETVPSSTRSTKIIKRAA